MVEMKDGVIMMHTDKTSYILEARRDGTLENLYYGGRIEVDDVSPLRAKVDAGYGMDVVRHEGMAALSGLCLELSPQQRGDYRRGALLARMPHGGLASDYAFEKAKMGFSAAPAGGMPHAKDGDETVTVSFSEPSGVSVELFYTLFEKADVITKRVRITNHGQKPVLLLRALSSQLDLPRSDYSLYTLSGAWARECHLKKKSLSQGIQMFGNNTGSSGNQCNPFFFLAERGATEQSGGVYGFNLVYSGNHEASVEVDAQGKTRVLQGIHSDGFSWPLAPGESFLTPEAVLTFSEEGKTGMSHNMHRFIKDHILPKPWRDRPRPVLLNNWEGTYFNFNEQKLLSIAKVAAKLGVELFVLDDGWFGRRDNDRAGLGDYDVDRKKLPSGLAGLARKLKTLGLDFGLWFEPEMVNRDSRLFETHPDWIVQTPGYEPGQGRNQYVLDLCRREVRDYIVASMGEVLDSAPIAYVKWDMNRYISDAFSPALQDQGTFFHRFTMGLYDLFERICTLRPDILFEGCSSGGNRFDLGVLCYMPQIWTSDDTDAHIRQKIQTGASYGYPPCTMGCHVSAVPNHQTLRSTPLDTRFNTAAFGLLGYELDVRHLTREEKEDVAAQIEFYKNHRGLLQFGDFYRLVNPFEEDGCRWIVVSKDKSEAIVGDYMDLLQPNSAVPPMRLRGLDAKTLYTVAVRPQKVNIKTFGGIINYILPVHMNPGGFVINTASKVYRLPTEKEAYKATGELLCKAGVQRMQAFSGAGYSEYMRIISDFSSRLYVVKRT
ncbi:alpha-galactosidase [Ruminococcaceae bacterium OttesenSCG-928-I18]|nr:alpha-galactosidase [Ruminococcaceae bacterium OttesenSCG-928-I18]